MFLIKHRGQILNDDFGSIRKFESVGYAIEFLHQKEPRMEYFNMGDVVQVFTGKDLVDGSGASYLIQKI